MSILLYSQAIHLSKNLPCIKVHTIITQISFSLFILPCKFYKFYSKVTSFLPFSCSEKILYKNLYCFSDIIINFGLINVSSPLNFFHHLQHIQSILFSFYHPYKSSTQCKHHLIFSSFCILITCISTIIMCQQYSIHMNHIFFIFEHWVVCTQLAHWLPNMSFHFHSPCSKCISHKVHNLLWRRLYSSTL